MNFFVTYSSVGLSDFMMLSFVTPVPSGSDAKTQAFPTPFRSASAREISLVLRPMPGEGIAELFGRLADGLQGAAILHLQVFGLTGASAAVMTTMQKIFGKVDWPVTWAEGAACDGGIIAGIEVAAFTGGVERLRAGGRVMGSVFSDESARHCLLGGLKPARPGSSRADQAKQTLKKMESVLGQAGFSLADTVRTWFFLDDILSWYDEFNRVRTQVYSGIKFRAGSLPASTGVGARNPGGAALTVVARAMQPLSDHARAEEIASPLQCPAPAYGSSFSRAMEVSGAAGRRLFISGTASIAPGGETLWQGEIHRQVDLTMKVVEALLRSRGFSFADLTRSTAYFKNPSDVSVFTDWCAQYDLSLLPVVAARCDLCRDNLLFELEAEAQQTA